MARRNQSDLPASPGLGFDEPVSLPPPEPLDPVAFRRALRRWYGAHARELPWRGVHDPYRTWLSEIMLQQTRVATVVDRFRAFTAQFPSVAELAVADEDDVLALWSGLGYYRRARMLHRGAQFVMRELDGHLPRTADELRTLPGVGAYTSAAIASIAFGESVAVLDGNVERVLLRILGLPEETGATARERLMTTAQALMPPESRPPLALRRAQFAAEEAARDRVLRHGQGVPGGDRPHPRTPGEHIEWNNAPGDHNQAMMELGATICVPRSPLCHQCPVVRFCETRGEHRTADRKAPRSRRVAFLLAIRKHGVATEVLLARRPDEASLMPGMLELPPLPLEAVEGREPVQRLRHSITDTNYYVEIFSEGALRPATAMSDGVAVDLGLFDLHPPAEPEDLPEEERVFRASDHPPHGEDAGTAVPSLVDQIPAAAADLRWTDTGRLPQLPLTGLARKALSRLGVMVLPPVRRG